MPFEASSQQQEAAVLQQARTQPQREEAARVIRHSRQAGETRETATHPVIPKETAILCSHRRGTELRERARSSWIGNMQLRRMHPSVRCTHCKHPMGSVGMGTASESEQVSVSRISSEAPGAEI